MSRTLHSRALGNIRLEAAIQDCEAVFAASEVPAVALLYTPEKCLFARLVGVELLGPDNQPIPLNSVYEARVFSPQAELRWLNGPDGKHRAAILSESEIPIDDGRRLESIVTVDDIEDDNQYLLWGKSTGPAPGRPGWSLLNTPRIGDLMIPLADVKPGRRVILKAREYLAAEEEHGNVSVVEERLMKLEVVND